MTYGCVDTNDSRPLSSRATHTYDYSEHPQATPVERHCLSTVGLFPKKFTTEITTYLSR